MRWISILLSIVLTVTSIELSFGFDWITEDACATECCASAEKNIPDEDQCPESNCDPILCCTSVWYSIHSSEPWDFQQSLLYLQFSTYYYLTPVPTLHYDIWQPPKI